METEANAISGFEEEGGLGSVINRMQTVELAINEAVTKNVSFFKFLDI